MAIAAYSRVPGVSLAKAGGLPPKRGQSVPEDNSQDLPTKRTDRTSGLSQVAFQSTTIDVQRLQACLRSAERGQTWQFYSFVRDMVAGFPHLNAEWAKRKMVIVGQSLSLIPPAGEDETGCNVIREAIENCGNWQDGLQHLLDATLFPMAAAEKIWDAVPSSGNRFKFLKRFSLKEIAPVSYTTFCFDVPYRPAKPGLGVNPAQVFDADEWESWLRFYKTEPNGMVDFGLDECIKPDPSRHIIHRGILQSTIVPPNWGGLIRSILFLWLLSGQDRDWWALMMNKYGMPIPTAKVNDNNRETMKVMREALSLGCQLGGIVIPKNAELLWSPGVGADGAQAHKMFQDWLFNQVSLLAVGQSTSARPEKGGLAAGMAEQSEAVRDDVRVFDVMKLGSTLKRQLFRQILDVNGYYNLGTPDPYWGGMAASDLKNVMGSLQAGYSAGVRLTQPGVVTLSQRSGLSFERIPDEIMNPKPAPMGGKGSTN